MCVQKPRTHRVFRDTSLSKATRRWYVRCATFCAAVGARGAAIWQVQPSLALARCAVTVRAHSLRCVVGSRTAKTRRACVPSEVDTRSASSANASACASQRSAGLARTIARSAPPARPSTAPSPRGSIGRPVRSPMPQDVAQRYSLAQMSVADDTALRWPCVKRPPTRPHRARSRRLVRLRGAWCSLCCTRAAYSTADKSETRHCRAGWPSTRKSRAWKGPSKARTSARSNPVLHAIAKGSTQRAARRYCRS